MKFKVCTSSVSSETGQFLVEALQNKDAYDSSSENIVCYGKCPALVTGRVLNANCKLDKIARMKMMAKDDRVRLVPWTDDPKKIDSLWYPVLARKANGLHGKDIRPIFQSEELEWRKDAGWDWFSKHVPIQVERRVWVFRDKVLDTYEKEMVRPEEFTRIGRNHENGFAFKRLEAEHHPSSFLAIAAVDALGLDFGAVDILEGKDGICYVLEVNTAPGVTKGGSHRTLVRLAKCIAGMSDEKVVIATPEASPEAQGMAVVLLAMASLVAGLIFVF